MGLKALKHTIRVHGVLNSESLDGVDFLPAPKP